MESFSINGARGTAGAQIKLTVVQTVVNKSRRPARVKVNLELLFRLEKNPQPLDLSDGNEKIKRILEKWREHLQ